LKPNVESYCIFLSQLSKRDRAKKVFALTVIKFGDMEFLNIRDLCERSGLTRPTLHAAFGERNKESAVIAIYREVLSDFTHILIRRLENLFEFLASSPPMDLLIRLFQAILFAVKEEPEYALVCFQEISLANEEELRIVSPAFNKATELLGEAWRDARERGDINKDTGILKEHQAIHILFYAVRATILAHFGEGKPPDEKEFLSEVDAYVEVLRILKLYAPENASGIIDERISEAKERRSGESFTRQKPKKLTAPPAAD
jgi:AcrR family transcriptional regulator